MTSVNCDRCGKDITLRSYTVMAEQLLRGAGEPDKVQRFAQGFDLCFDCLSELDRVWREFPTVRRAKIAKDTVRI